MKVLSPSKLYPGHFPERGGCWYRLARTDDGLLYLENISDATLTRASQDPAPPWAYVADLPPHVAEQLTDDDDPDVVARVLTRAVLCVVGDLDVHAKERPS